MFSGGGCARDGSSIGKYNDCSPHSTFFVPQIHDSCVHVTPQVVHSFVTMENSFNAKRLQSLQNVI